MTEQRAGKAKSLCSETAKSFYDLSAASMITLPVSCNLLTILNRIDKIK